MPTLVFLFSELILIGVFDLFPWAIETFSESWCPETAPEKQMKFFSETRLVAENFGWGIYIYFCQVKSRKTGSGLSRCGIYFSPPPYRDQPYRCQPVVCLLSHCQHLHIYGQRSLRTLPHKQKKAEGLERGISTACYWHFKSPGDSEKVLFQHFVFTPLRPARRTACFY